MDTSSVGQKGRPDERQRRKQWAMGGVLRLQAAQSALKVGPGLSRGATPGKATHVGSSNINKRELNQCGLSQRTGNTHTDAWQNALSFGHSSGNDGSDCLLVNGFFFVVVGEDGEGDGVGCWEALRAPDVELP